MLFPMAELRSVTTPELKSMFAMVNRIKYTPVENIVDYIKNIPKMSGPIEVTSMVTRINMNLGCPKMANLAYIEEDVHVLGIDYFVHVHILCEEPDHSLSMMYGRKVIQLPNPGLRLYSCERLTLQFDWMGEARHNFIGHLTLVGELARRQHSRPRLHQRLTLISPSGTLGMEVATWVTMSVVTTPLMVILSLASESKPPPLLGTSTGTLFWSSTSVIGLTRLSTRWKGLDDSRNG
jgi:hypothetical protein